VIEMAVIQTKLSIKEGESIAQPLAASKVFPPMVTRMISVGEQTGKLEEMLSKIADFYESEVDAAVSGLTSLIEPLIIAFLGIVVGGIVVSMFLPIVKLIQVVAK
ncbi:MAG: type II secretion system F family protein, partial [Candidatus Omnitrophota bacterium]